MSMRAQPTEPQVGISFQLGESIAYRASVAAAVNRESRSSLFRRAIITEIERLEARHGVVLGAHTEPSPGTSTPTDE